VKRALVLLLTLACCAGAFAAPDRVTAIHSGRLLDVRSGRIVQNAVVVVRGNRIAAWGERGSTRIPDGAERIDLGDMTLLPGLIDCHTHLVDSAESYSVAGPLQTSAAAMALGAVPHARATLRAGFTTVRDLGTYRAFVDVALRDAIDRGAVEGPRMQTCGAYVTISGGAGALTGLAHDLELPVELRYGVADGPDQVRARVRAVVRQGATVIKILATGAVLTPGSEPGAQEMTYEEMRAAVEEASKAGLRVACHAHGAAGAKDAIRAGVASIEHGSLLDEEALRMMLARGVFLVPDTYNADVIMQRPQGYLQEFLDKQARIKAAHEEVVRKAIKMGVRIAYGTDAAVIPHGDNGKQFASYVQLGMTPLQAIQTATISAADLLGWSDRIGHIDAGLYADLIAVPGNPLLDVKVLERPALVMKNGQVVSTPARP